MRYLKRVLPGFALAGILMSGGCGEREEQPTRFNRALGDTAVGVPTAIAPIDTGILRDQTKYTPANYERLEMGFAGAGAGGPDAEAIRRVFLNQLEALLELNIDTMLDAYVPEQVAALREDEYVSTFYETKDTLDTFWAVFRDKATGPEFEPFVKLIELLPQLAEPLANTAAVTVLDDEHALAKFELQRMELPPELQAQLMEAFQQIMAVAMGAMMSQMAAGTGGGPGPGAPPPTDPNAGGPPPAAPAVPSMPEMPGGVTPEMLQNMLSQGEGLQSQFAGLPLRKIDGQWRIALPFSVNEEQAEWINEVALLVKDFVSDVTVRIDQAETLDAATFGQIVMQTGTRMTPAFLGLAARADALFGTLVETPPDEGAAAQQPEGEQPAAEPTDPNAAGREPNASEPPSREGGRRRRP